MSGLKKENGLLIIANFNQEVEIGQVLDRVKRWYGTENAVVVDDGSTDRSAEIAKQKGFIVIRHGRNRGIGAAIASGIDHALKNPVYRFVTIMSSNGKIQPEQIDFLSEPLLRGECDYVQGSRFINSGDSQGLTYFRKLTIPMFTWFANLILGRHFSDITCGFRCYKLDILRHPRVKFRQRWLERYELEYYIHYWACRLGFKIKEVPVTIRYTHLAKNRRTKIKPFSGWWSMMRPFVYLAIGARR